MNSLLLLQLCLREAAADGDRELVQVLLNKGIPVEAVRAREREKPLRDSSSFSWQSAANDHVTPLMMAASKGQVQVAKLLLQQGADIYAEDRHHETVLIYAFRHNQYSMLSFLIAQGADIECRDSSGRTLLMLAAAKGDPRMISALMCEGPTRRSKSRAAPRSWSRR